MLTKLTRAKEGIFFSSVEKEQADINTKTFSV